MTMLGVSREADQQAAEDVELGAAYRECIGLLPRGWKIVAGSWPERRIYWAHAGSWPEQMDPPIFNAGAARNQAAAYRDLAQRLRALP